MGNLEGGKKILGAPGRYGKIIKELKELPRTRFERVTYCLGGSCSILLSYRGASVRVLMTLLKGKFPVNTRSFAEISRPVAYVLCKIICLE